MTREDRWLSRNFGWFLFFAAVFGLVRGYLGEAPDWIGWALGAAFAVVLARDVWLWRRREGNPDSSAE